MTRNQLMWVLVLFFGCSLLFGYLRRATEGQDALVIAGVQLGALAVVVLGVWLVVRRLRG